MAGARTGRRSRALCAWSLACLLVVTPGCRALGVGASYAYDWGSSVFAANPVSVGFYYAGLGLGFVATAPLLLFTWPLTALCYPSGEDAFYGYAVTAPGHYLGVVLSTVMAAPFYPFGWPLMPDEPEPPPGPHGRPQAAEEGAR